MSSALLACAGKATAGAFTAGLCSISLACSARQAFHASISTAAAATMPAGLCSAALTCAPLSPPCATYIPSIHHRFLSTTRRAAFAAPSLDTLERQILPHVRDGSISLTPDYLQLQQLEQLRDKVQALEAAEACRSALGRLLTLLDAARLDPLLINAALVAELFTPAAKVDAEKLGSAVTLEQVLPLLQKLATQGGHGRRHTTNIVAEPSRHDPSIVKASAYCLTVEPVAGAKPVATSMHTIQCRMEKDLDDKWRIKQLTLVEAVGST